ncbi:MAG: hypothetical protein HUJ66_04570 [Oscillospiraceae bacterium]|nr:hypothetical protein [Oscillospiraceae bacterium]
MIIPTDSLDNALLGVAKNYEYGIMRRHLTGGYRHITEFWELAEQYACDMVLMNDDITCKGAMGMAGIICRPSPAEQDIRRANQSRGPISSESAGSIICRSSWSHARKKIRKYCRISGFFHFICL